MNPNQGKFVWYELMTTDGAAAAKFYGDVVGWKPQKSPTPNMDYTLFYAGAAQVAGAFTLSKEELARGSPSAWAGYIATDDVDDAVAQVKAAGGKILHPSDDIPNVGRFAMVTDPQGAAFALFKSARAEEVSPADIELPGHIGWHELYAGDAASVFAFYHQLFGWKKSQAMDMGSAGTYQMFDLAGGGMIGGVMTKPPQMPVPAWLYYFNVGSIDAAAARVKAAGGQITNGPNEVPGGQWIVQGIDPQGAHFALLGSK
jgi:uncharacterized protein